MEGQENSSWVVKLLPNYFMASQTKRSFYLDEIVQFIWALLDLDHIIKNDL